MSRKIMNSTLSYSCRSRDYAGESENGGNDRHDEEDGGAMEHGALLVDRIGLYCLKHNSVPR